MKPAYLLSLVCLGGSLVQAAPLQERTALASPDAYAAPIDYHPVEARDPRFIVGSKPLPAAAIPSFWTFLKNKVKGAFGEKTEE